MNLSQLVDALQSQLSNLKPNDAKFAADLIASYKKYGKLTPKQEPWISKLLVRAQVTVAQGLYPALATAPHAAAEVTEPVNIGGLEGVVALFTAAQAHLKYPKISLKLDGIDLKLSLNGAKSKTPGSIAVVRMFGPKNYLYLGRVSPEGQFMPSHIDPSLKAMLVNLLTQFSKSPARVAKAHGKLTGNCCFCNKPIGIGEDKRSVLVGFGPVCADHYGLKAQWLNGVAKAEAKASVAGTMLSETLMSHGVSPEIVAAINEQTAADEQIESIAAEFETEANKGLDSLKSVGQAIQDIGKAFGQATDEVETLGAKFVVVKTVEPKDSFMSPGEYDLSLVTKTCFFCEQPSVETKELNGYVVCSGCAKQLV